MLSRGENRTRLPNRRMPMVRWYNPLFLLRAGFRVAISNTFGMLPDKRDVQAALAAISPADICTQYDYSERDEIWIDFAADLGEGWYPTHAIASAIAAERLEVSAPGGGAPVTLPRASIFIMGGDLVYPLATRAEYESRLAGPYEDAVRGQQWEDPRPDLFAIPGNHDWYDGLNAFDRIFCRANAGPTKRAGRPFAAWQTRQSRSYFALKLPHRWWLWGIDIQLSG